MSNFKKPSMERLRKEIEKNKGSKPKKQTKPSKPSKPSKPTKSNIPKKPSGQSALRKRKKK